MCVGGGGVGGVCYVCNRDSNIRTLSSSNDTVFFLMNRFQRRNFHQRKVNKLKAGTPISLAFHMTLLDQPQLRKALLNKKQQA